MIGGQEKVSQAGAFLAGGHSVEDEEPKYGLCVFGEVEKTSLWKVTGANPGDVIIITKPVGSGIIATAIKADMVDEPRWAESATRWMETLNNLPLSMTDEQRKAVSSCTDVTGFGLAGHMLDMLSRKDIDVELDISSLPVMEGAAEMASMGLVPAGGYSNKELYEGRVLCLEKAGDMADFLFDPQTSGGLLLTIAPEKAEELINTAVEAGFTETAMIGHIVEGKGNIIIKE